MVLFSTQWTEKKATIGLICPYKSESLRGQRVCKYNFIVIFRFLALEHFMLITSSRSFAKVGLFPMRLIAYKLQDAAMFVAQAK